jgi:hypothetical protein
MRQLVCIVGILVILTGICLAGDVEIGGLVQIQYVDRRATSDDPGIGEFLTKAARLKAKGMLTENITFQTQFDVARQPEVLDAFIDYSFSRAINFRIGQFKLPFGFETQASRFDLEAVNRSQVLSYLWSNGVSRGYNRDIGLVFMGQYQIFNYKIGCVNGVGYNYSPDPDTDGLKIFPKWGRDNNNSKDIVGRIGIGVPMMAGLGFSFYEGKWYHKTPPAEPVSESEPEVDVEPDGDKDRKAKGFDLYLDAGKMLIQYESVWAKGPASHQEVVDDEGNTAWVITEHGGYFVVLGYRVTPLVEPVVKVDVYDPNKDMDGDRQTDFYFGCALNFERKARLQLFYVENKVAKRFANSEFLMQMSAKF